MKKSDRKIKTPKNYFITIKIIFFALKKKKNNNKNQNGELSSKLFSLKQSFQTFINIINCVDLGNIRL